MTYVNVVAYEKEEIFPPDNWLTGDEIVAFDKAVFSSGGFTDFVGNVFAANTNTVIDQGIVCASGQEITTRDNVIFDCSKSFTVDLLYCQNSAANLAQFNFITYMKDNPNKIQLLMQNQWNGSAIRIGAWYGTGSSWAESQVAQPAVLSALRTTEPVEFRYVYDANAGTHTVYINGAQVGRSTAKLRAVPSSVLSVGCYGTASGGILGVIDRYRLRPGIYLN